MSEDVWYIRFQDVDGEEKELSGDYSDACNLYAKILKDTRMKFIGAAQYDKNGTLISASGRYVGRNNFYEMSEF